MLTAADKDAQVKSGTRRWEYYIGILGVILTIGMAVAVIYYWEWVRELEHYGYAGAFFISILGGATIIVPVPMLP